MAGNRPIRWLVAALLAAGLVSCALAPIEVHIPAGPPALSPLFRAEYILVVPACALCLCQALLLALWAVGAASSPWRRVGGLVAGTAYLEVLLGFATQEELLGGVTVTTVVTSAALIVLRVKGFRLLQCGDKHLSAGAKAGITSFSIRGLMMFTAAVALLSAGLKFVWGVLPDILVFTMAWGLCFVAVGLLSLWALLGVARSVRRSVILLAVSLTLGVLFVITTSADGWVYVILIMLLYPLTLFASLRVIRSCGYRYAGRAVGSPGRSSGEGQAEDSQVAPTAGQAEAPG